jgi:hypothetical protein
MHTCKLTSRLISSASSVGIRPRTKLLFSSARVACVGVRFNTKAIFLSIRHSPERPGLARALGAVKYTARQTYVCLTLDLQLQLLQYSVHVHVCTGLLSTLTIGRGKHRYENLKAVLIRWCRF